MAGTKVQNLALALFVLTFLSGGPCPGLATAQPDQIPPKKGGLDAKAAEADPGEVFKKAKELDEVAEKRNLQIKEHQMALLKAIEKLPPGLPDLKGEKIVWDKLLTLVPELVKENQALRAAYPKYAQDYKLLSAALDQAISGSLEAAKICEGDAGKQKRDDEREDYLTLASLARKAAERRKQDKTRAAGDKVEIDKLIAQAEQDQRYFERLLQVVELVRLPLEKQQATDQFAQRLRRYFEHREQLRKSLREITDKLEPYSQPTAPKVSKIETPQVPAEANKTEATAIVRSGFPVVLIGDENQAVVKLSGSQLTRNSHLVIERDGHFLGTATVRLAYGGFAVIQSQTPLLLGDVAMPNSAVQVVRVGQ